MNYDILKSKIISWTKISKIWRWKETNVQIIKGVLVQITHISQSSRHLYKGVIVLLCFKRKWQIVALQLLSSSLRFLFYQICICFIFSLFWCKCGDQIWAILQGGIILIWLYSTAEMIYFQHSTPEYWKHECDLFHSLFAELNVNNC